MMIGQPRDQQSQGVEISYGVAKRNQVRQHPAGVRGQQFLFGYDHHEPPSLVER